MCLILGMTKENGQAVTKLGQGCPGGNKEAHIPKDTDTQSII